LIKAELIKWGFEQSLAEPCLFVNHTTGVILLVYVDDIAAAAKSKIQLQRFFETLSARFNAKNLGEIEKILGARVTRDRKNRTLYLDQEQYLTTVLDRFGSQQRSTNPRRFLLLTMNHYALLMRRTNESMSLSTNKGLAAYSMQWFSHVLILHLSLAS
jgi:hypothetical protein